MSLSDFLTHLQHRNTTQSLAEIGAELGVSHVTVGRWMAHKRKPSETVLILAAKLWGASWPL